MRWICCAVCQITFFNAMAHAPFVPRSARWCIHCMPNLAAWSYWCFSCAQVWTWLGWASLASEASCVCSAAAHLCHTYMSTTHCEWGKITGNLSKSLSMWPKFFAYLCDGKASFSTRNNLVPFVMQNIHETMGLVLAYQVRDIWGKWRVGGKTNTISCKEKDYNHLSLTCWCFGKVCSFQLSTTGVADQAGILFLQGSSNLDAGIMWTENAEIRLFAVKNQK